MVALAAAALLMAVALTVYKLARRHAKAPA
jgi:hypothetical protein